MIETWKQFVAGQPLLSAPAKPILESWHRCKAFDVATARAHLRRVPLPELKERLERGEPRRHERHDEAASRRVDRSVLEHHEVVFDLREAGETKEVSELDIP